jgi:hypothetical protein
MEEELLPPLEEDRFRVAILEEDLVADLEGGLEQRKEVLGFGMG